MKKVRIIKKGFILTVKHYFKFICTSKLCCILKETA